MPQPTPPRLHKAKAAGAAAVVATTAALTAGLAAPAPEALAAPHHTAQADVQLAAVTVPELPDIPDLAGGYAVGPVFWTARALGLDPANIIGVLGGLTGNTELAETITQLLGLFEQLAPIEGGVKGPNPDDVYNAVNGLDYTVTGLAELLGVSGLLADLIDRLVDIAPIINQRRDVILSESLGGLSTSLAYRDMIEAVTSDDPEWGAGVTGQWLIMVNNISRPGGGLLSLATPFTDLFGLNLTTPDAGSYTNADRTKVLNTSILDLTWAYNPLSDVPTTLNPLSWANSVAAGVFLTYLLPDEGNNIVDHVLPQLVSGLLDGAKVMVDPTGGQGLHMLPGWDALIDAAAWFGLDDELEDLTEATEFPGTATHITYDSGNLALLEPFRAVPHLLNLLPGVYLPTPMTDSVEDALRKLVNMGYQDVDPDTLERSFAEAGEQAYLWHSPLTPTQRLAANEIVFDALIDGIQEHALNPEAWTPAIPGLDFAPVVQNAAAVAIATALSDALQAVQDAADPVFDAVETGLAPVTGVLDDVNAQIEGALDTAFGVAPQTPAAATQDRVGTRTLSAEPAVDATRPARATLATTERTTDRDDATNNRTGDTAKTDTTRSKTTKSDATSTTTKSTKSTAKKSTAAKHAKKPAKHAKHAKHAKKRAAA